MVFDKHHRKIVKKSILIFNGYYFPAKNYGGPSTSIKNLVNTCSDEFDFYIVVANHDFGKNEVFKNIQAGWNEVGKAKVLYVNDKEFTVKNIRKWIDETKASAIYLAGIYSLRNLKYIKAARDRNVSIVVPPRGELNPNAIRRKKYKKIPFLLFLRTLGSYKSVYFHATSEEEKRGIQKWFKIEPEKIFLLPNFPAHESEGEKSEKSERLTIVSISRICKTKNLLYSIKIVNKLTCNAIFDIYGPIEDKEYWKECMEEIEKHPLNVEIRYCGAIEPNKVGKIFKKYDCFLFPTLTENYGHSIVEALVNGCPVLLGKGTTPWDSLHQKAGYVVDLENPKGFIEGLETIAKMSPKDYRDLANSCAKFINEKTKYQELKKEYQEFWRKVICKK